VRAIAKKRELVTLRFSLTTTWTYRLVLNEVLHAKKEAEGSAKAPLSQGAETAGLNSFRRFSFTGLRAFQELMEALYFRCARLFEITINKTIKPTALYGGFFANIRNR
jgi:hypothetical protein